MIIFTASILGFKDLKSWTIVRRDGDNVFKYLTCLEPGLPLQLPVLQKNETELRVVTIPNDISLMTINDKAPIIIDLENKTLTQVVLPGDLPIRNPCFELFKTLTLCFGNK